MVELLCQVVMPPKVGVFIFQTDGLLGLFCSNSTCENNGRTAIQGAAESGSWEILSLLQSAGAYVNAPAGVVAGLFACLIRFCCSCVLTSGDIVSSNVL